MSVLRPLLAIFFCQLPMNMFHKAEVHKFQLNQANFEISFFQRALWIITDNFDWQERPFRKVKIALAAAAFNQIIS